MHEYIFVYDEFLQLDTTDLMKAVAVLFGEPHSVSLDLTDGAVFYFTSAWTYGQMWNMQLHTFPATVTGVLEIYFSHLNIWE